MDNIEPIQNTTANALAQFYNSQQNSRSYVYHLTMLDGHIVRVDPNSSVNQTLSLLSIIRPSLGCTLLLLIVLATTCLEDGIRYPTRWLSESVNQTLPLVSTLIPEICVPVQFTGDEHVP